jgi:hypothetical protein
MEEIGNDGTITVEEGKSIGLTKEIKTGMQFDQGYSFLRILWLIRKEWRQLLKNHIFWLRTKKYHLSKIFSNCWKRLLWAVKKILWLLQKM